MRPRSITGPLILIAIGVLFLLNNIWHDIPFWSILTDYWPEILIAVGVAGLIEVLWHVGRGTASPPRPIGGGIIWLLVIFMVFSWAGQRNGIHIGRLDTGGLTVLGTEYTYPVNAFGDTAGVTRVIFDNVRGNITMKGDAAGPLRVNGRTVIRAFNRGDADRANNDSQVRVTRQGDLLIVRAEDPKMMRMLSISTDVDVTLPKGLSVETRGRAGDVTVDDLDGSVDVSNGHGDIRLTNIGKDVKVESGHNGLIRISGLKGNLDLQGRGGDLQLENIQGQVTVNGEYGGTLEFQQIGKSLHFQSSRSDLRIAQVPGGVTLDGGEAKLTNLVGPVRFETRDRDVHITDVTDSLELTVDRGDVHIAESKTPLPKMDVKVRRSGEVTLAVPQKAGFTVDGRTSHGEIQNDFGAGLQVESSGRDTMVKGRTGDGAEIRISTERGNINLQKN